VRLAEQQFLIDRLSQGSWFGRMPQALREQVIARSSVRSYVKGQFLSMEGSPPKGLFAVLEGQVHLVAAMGTGDEALVHVGGPGFWFGEFGALTGSQTVVTAVAHAPVRALLFPKSQFDLIVEENPRNYRYFAELVYERYAALVRAFADIQETTPDARLRRRLAILVQLQRADRAEDVHVTLGVSQADLSRMIGVSRQTLNRLLGRLQEQGLIELGLRKIIVPDPRRLGEVATEPEESIAPSTAPRTGRSARL
jgi:CRP/FNR family transcriptional regulator, cyclic AMP receptor protein